MMRPRLSSKSFERDDPQWPAAPSATAVLFQAQRAASRACSSVSTPQAFAVDAQGVVLDLVVPGSERDIERLATRVSEGGEAGDTQLRAEASVS
jgi:hypothetical protein